MKGEAARRGEARRCNGEDICIFYNVKHYTAQIRQRSSCHVPWWTTMTSRRRQRPNPLKLWHTHRHNSLYSVSLLTANVPHHKSINIISSFSDSSYYYYYHVYMACPSIHLAILSASWTSERALSLTHCCCVVIIIIIINLVAGVEARPWWRGGLLLLLLAASTRSI